MLSTRPQLIGSHSCFLCLLFTSALPLVSVHGANPPQLAHPVPHRSLPALLLTCPLPCVESNRAFVAFVARLNRQL